MSEINVTPLVDVMLVLLIVFMVAAPLLAAGVPVDLPEAAAAPLAIERQPVTVTVKDGGAVYVGDEEVVLSSLVPRLRSLTTAADDRIYVRGDRAASYGTIMQVMGTITDGGFSRIALVALADKSG